MNLLLNLIQYEFFVRCDFEDERAFLSRHVSGGPDGVSAADHILNRQHTEPFPLMNDIILN